MSEMTWLWIGFNLFVLAMLALDLGVFHRKSHEVRPREALIWSGVWISLALVFNVLIYFFWDRVVPVNPNGGFGPEGYSNQEAALKFLTGYLIEKSLSIDNIFVFLLLFTYFSIPPKYQHRILFWGILGALLMRAGMIFAGVALIKNFHWTIYIFGAILIISGLKMWFSKDNKMEPEKNPVLRLFRKMMPVSDQIHGENFFIRNGAQWVATPLFVVLLLVETTDVLFAVDSIPAIIAITPDPFLVYTSNVFAILGLRSLYFALSGLMDLFHYLHYGLSAVLIFVGGKMILQEWIFPDGKMPTIWSLGIIATILAVSIGMSWIRPHKTPEAEKPGTEDEMMAQIEETSETSGNSSP